jgi:SAM-dependent methyltransferase
MTYEQYGNTQAQWRVDWVRETITKNCAKYEGGVFLDIGAGSSPYRDIVLEGKMQYLSQDFNQYLADSTQPGGHTENWHYAKHDFICDILQIPDHVQADVVLCSEVLEHVPDPVAALKKVIGCAKSGGVIIITTPFISLMHQAPFWFQSGFSPFWFEHWATEFGLTPDTIIVQGDYVDLVTQDFGRLMQYSFLSRVIFAVMQRLGLADSARKGLSHDVLSSGGCGTLVILKKG